MTVPVPVPVVVLLLLAFAVVACAVLAAARRRGAEATERLDEAIREAREAREDARWRDAYRRLPHLKP